MRLIFFPLSDNAINAFSQIGKMAETEGRKIPKNILIHLRLTMEVLLW